MARSYIALVTDTPIEDVAVRAHRVKTSAPAAHAG